MNVPIKNNWLSPGIGPAPITQKDRWLVVLKKYFRLHMWTGSENLDHSVVKQLQNFPLKRKDLGSQPEMDLTTDPCISKFSNHAKQKCGHEHNHLLLCVFQTELGAVCTPQVNHGTVNHSSWTVQLRPSVSIHRKPAHVWGYALYGTHYDHGYSSDT